MAIMKLKETPNPKLASIGIIKREEEDKLPEHPPQCPCCNSKNVYGISRVVGYFSIIENWNVSKQSELKRRQQGNYWTNGEVED
jgi:anaerobic ribonucleoside-triphosphate reductase